MRSLIPFRRKPKVPAYRRHEPVMTRAPVRHDPAPSLWEYRMQRVMLTPYLRALLRVGLPSFVLLCAAGLYIANDNRRAEVVGFFTDLREKFQQRPEFSVTLASIEGASTDLAEAVRSRLHIKLPVSSFDLELDAIKERIENLDAVKSAELRVRTGGVLQVLITERQPVAVWRQAEGLTLIDDTGHRVASLIERTDRADLPLVLGAGADRAMPEAMAILAASGPLATRVRGLIRMGERRWDIALDRDQRIMLPEAQPVRALERMLAMDHAQDILSRDLGAVDLRLAQRPTLRMTPYAMNEYRRAKGLKIVETEL